MIDRILNIVKESPKVSDFHLRANCPFSYRLLGEINILEGETVKIEDIDEILNKFCSKEDVESFNSKNELDSGFMIENKRFRANFYKTLKGPAVVLRKVETEIINMETLNLPPVMYSIVDMHKGLVLVTGPTGSGKSTTLASIINQINETRQANIITIEDPVEFIHKDKKSIISQREVGKQTESFSTALKSALREDPDVILVGELRDIETISMALTAAETGHLVFGTLHTSGAPNTINRIIDVFPSEQQAQIQAQLADSLQMVITQKLFKTTDGNGRVGAFEIMVCNSPVKNLIREKKIHQIPSVMQTGTRDGMMSMEKSIENLIQSGKINSIDAKQ